MATIEVWDVGTKVKIVGSGTTDKDMLYGFITDISIGGTTHEVTYNVGYWVKDEYKTLGLSPFQLATAYEDDPYIAIGFRPPVISLNPSESASHPGS